MKRSNSFIPFALAASIICASAAAHPMLITHGEARFEGDTLVGRFEATDHDLAHMPDVPANEDEAHFFARSVADSLALFDERGEPIPPRLEMSPAPRGARFSIRYAVPPAARFLTFQQRTGADTIPIPRLIELALWPRGSDNPEAMRLSAGGNPETIDTRREPAASAAEAWTAAPDRFTTIYIVLRVEESRVTVQSRIPAPLVGTWSPTSTHHADRIDTAEQTAIAADGANLVRSRATLAIDGKARPMTLDHRAVLKADGKEGDAEPVCFWSARAAATLSADLPSGASRIVLEWSGFNSAVLAANGVLIIGEKTQELALTPSMRTIELRRDGDWAVVSP